MNQRALVLVGAGLALVGGVLAWQLSGSTSRAEAEDTAWGLIAAGHSVHYCTAPEAAVYRSRDVSFLHPTARGLGVATHAPTGDTTLLDGERPIGHLSWTPEGCKVDAVRTRPLTIEVREADGTPVEGAYVASCVWLPLAATDSEGRVAIEVPTHVRCKIQATLLVEETSFRASEGVALADEGDVVTLTLSPETAQIADQKREVAAALDLIGNRAQKTAYDHAMEDASPAVREVLGEWKAQYRDRQKAALKIMRHQLDEEELGWVRLSR
ncbi:MAG: hypothetical protein EP330_06350 [Deltaproteobacteria bacterium]|nr:MAG: hypothetical protein EP330_06350 [Deltaproteobacteria bacterium]